MNILLFNQTWFADELRSMGHNVLTCGPAPHLEHQTRGSLIHINEILHGLPTGFMPDRLVWLDNSSPCLIVGLEDCSIPKVLYSVDSQHHAYRHSFLANAFDHVLTAQKDYIPQLERCLNPVSWMPLWAPEYVEKSADKKFGATFVGTLNPALNPDRVAFFEALEKLIPMHITTGYYPNIFPHAEIVVNQTVKGDLNFRVFEAMMCGALLLTEKTENGLLELFQGGYHLVTYTPRDPHDAAEKIRMLSENRSTMRTIAEAGREEVLAKHTMQHRAVELEKLLRSLQSRPPSPQRYYDAMISLSLDSQLFEPLNQTASLQYAHASLDAAEQALALGVAPNDDQIALLIRGCIHHDRLLTDERGTRIVTELAEMFPDRYIFSLLHVRTLLNTGRHAEAKELALQISGNPPEQTFHEAEYAANLLMTKSC